VEFHETLRPAFLDVARQEPKRFAVIDGRPPRDVVAERIWEAVAQRLLGEAAAPAEAAAP
jgi:dTMP kinase